MLGSILRHHEEDQRVLPVKTVAYLSLSLRCLLLRCLLLRCLLLRCALPIHWRAGRSCGCWWIAVRRWFPSRPSRAGCVRRVKRGGYREKNSKRSKKTKKDRKKQSVNHIKKKDPKKRPRVYPVLDTPTARAGRAASI